MSVDKRTKKELLAEIERLQDRIEKLSQAIDEPSVTDSLFASLADSAPVGIFILQGERFVYVNEAMTKLAGVSREQYSTLTYWERVHPDDRNMVEQRGRARQAGEKVPDDYEVRYVRDDGSVRWARFRGRRIVYKGKPATLGTVVDVTEERHVTEELRRSREAYRLLLETSDDAVFMLDRDGRFLYLNEVAARQLGGEPERFIGQTQWDLFPREVAELQMKTVRQVLDTGKPVKVERKTILGDEEYTYYTSLLPLRDTEEQITSVMGIARDVSELARTRDALRDSERRLRRLLDNLPVGVFQATRGGEVISGNPALARMYGCETVDEYLALPAYESFRYPEQRDEIIEIARKNGSVIDYEVQMKRRDGSYFWISLSGHSVFNDDGELTHFDGIEIDVTDRHRAEDAARRTGETLRALLNAPSNPLFLLDRDGYFLALNEATALRAGKTVEEMVGTRLYDYLDEEVARGRRAAIQSVLETGKPETMGDIREDESFELRYYPVRHGSDRIDGVAVSMIDITERVKAEKAIQESETLFRSLAEAAPVGILVYQKQKLVYANPRILETTGIRAEDLGEIDFWNFIHPDYKQLVRVRGLARQRGEPVPARYEVKYVNADGEERWALYAGRPIIFQGAPAVLGVVIDITEHREMEEALAESEEKYRHLFENAQAGMFRTAIDGSAVLDANKKFADIWGYSVDEVKRVSALDGWYYPEERKRIVRELKERGELEDFEIALKTKDGRQKHASVSAKLYPDKGYLEGVVVDITERKRIEQAVRDSQAQMKAILENTDDFILLSDQDAKPIYFNSAYARVMNELIGIEMKPGLQPHSMLPDPEARAVWDGYHDRVLKGERFKIEHSFPMPDGTTRYFVSSFYPIADRDGKVQGFSEITQEITERKMAEEALRESEEKFRRIAERSFDAIFLVGLNQVITYASPSVEQVLGYRPDEMEGRPVTDFMPPESFSATAASFEQATADRPVEALQIDLYSAEGSLTTVEINATSVKREGRVVAVQAMMRDVTARKKAEEMLARAYERQSIQLRQVAGGLAHDVYNDLFPVTASLHKLKQRMSGCDNPMRERNLKLINLMESAVRRAITLTESVNLYSKLDADGTEEWTPVERLFEEVLNQNMGRIKQLSIDVSSKITEPIRIRCPHTQAFHLLNNLIINALDALERSEQRHLDLRADIDEKLARIQVADSGTGISEADLDRIFEPFYSTKPQTGTGLGLAIAKRVVDIYGGRIEFESILDKGTVFSVFISGDVGT